ncbi:type 1 fimbrial protein [Enterobacter asburiae]|uniref:fimbrial protein n=1 Tax=Enterobacter asburiae TaxID=61645 RepID=UPI002175F65D|nr:fimbrial protein [Enterobacter asburiae]MCS5456945.1 type 1 fimbrial protein [Enterobacter asburiae]
MKLKFIAMTAFPALFSMSSMAADDSAIINFTGSIAASTCAIDANNRTMAVDLGEINPNVFIGSNEHAMSEKQIAIQIDKSTCNLDTTFVTFTGDHSDDVTLLNTTAENLKIKLENAMMATGVGIATFDGARFGQDWFTGSAIIKLNPYVVKTGELTPGSFTATATVRVVQL